MNSSKIHSLIIEQHDDLALLQWFMDRGDDRACRDIIRYLHILGDDIDRLVDDSISLPGEGKSQPNLAQAKGGPFGEGRGTHDGELTQVR